MNRHCNETETSKPDLKRSEESPPNKESKTVSRKKKSAYRNRSKKKLGWKTNLTRPKSK
jgi:hypothetical protein